MKKLMFIWIIPCFFILSCSPNLAIKSDADQSYRLKEFKTYQLQSNVLEKPNNPFYENELNNRRIKTAINKQLSARGYQLTENKPDMIIQYSFQVKERLEEQYDNRFDYFYYYPYRLRDVNRLKEYEVGQLTLDFKDGKSKETIWIGAAMDILAKGLDGIEKRIDSATNQLLNEFHNEMSVNGSAVAWQGNK